MLIHDVLAEYLLTQGDTEVKDYDIGNTIERLTHQIDGEPTPLDLQYTVSIIVFNPIALRKAKIVCNFGLSEHNRVKLYAILAFLSAIGLKNTHTVSHQWGRREKNHAVLLSHLQQETRHG